MTVPVIDLIKASKKVGEIAIHTIDVELRKANWKWGGFRDPEEIYRLSLKIAQLNSH